MLSWTPSLWLHLCHSQEVFKTSQTLTVRQIHQTRSSGYEDPQHLVGSSGLPQDPDVSFPDYLPKAPLLTSRCPLLSLHPPHHCPSHCWTPQSRSRCCSYSRAHSQIPALRRKCVRSLLQAKPPPPPMKALPTVCRGLSGSTRVVWVPSPRLRTETSTPSDPSEPLDANN